MDIRCLAYNTRLFTDSPGAWIYSQTYYDPIRINDIIDQVERLRPQPDIICFSEVWGKRTKDKFLYELRDRYPYSASDNEDSLFQMGSGLLLLSRFPLSNVSFTKYSHLVGEDNMSKKGFILATVQPEWERVLIVCTHIQAGNNDAAMMARRANIFELLDSISDAVKDSTPVILLGDLNFSAENQTGTPTSDYEFVREVSKRFGMSDAFRTLNPNARSAPGYTYDAVNNKSIARFTPSDATNRVRGRLNYFFVRGIKPTSVTIPNSFTFDSPDKTGKVDLSDHYPLLGEFSSPS